MAPANNGNGGAADLRLINGGAELTARFGDGSSELILVREVPIRSMERYLACLQDEEKLIELFCTKPEGWAAKLTSSSYTEIIGKGEEINDPLFDAWYQRRLNRIERLNPGFRKNLENTVRQSAEDAVKKSAAASASPDFASPLPPATG